MFEMFSLERSVILTSSRYKSLSLSSLATDYWLRFGIFYKRKLWMFGNFNNGSAYNFGLIYIDNIYNVDDEFTNVFNYLHSWSYKLFKIGKLAKLIVVILLLSILRAMRLGNNCKGLASDNYMYDKTNPYKLGVSILLIDLNGAPWIFNNCKDEQLIFQ